MSLAEAKTILGTALGVAPEALPDDASIASYGEWDSLSHYQLVLDIEQAIGKQLDPEVAMEIKSVADIAAILESARKPAADTT